MKKLLFSTFLIGAFAFATALFLPLAAPAADASTAIIAEVTAPAATPVIDPGVLPDPWASLIALVTPFIVAGIKMLTPKINTKWLPVIAAAIGFVLAILTHYTTGLDVTWWQGLLLGLAGVGLRELGDQVRQPAHTVESNETP